MKTHEQLAIKKEEILERERSKKKGYIAFRIQCIEEDLGKAIAKDKKYLKVSRWEVNYPEVKRAIIDAGYSLLHKKYYVYIFWGKYKDLSDKEKLRVIEGKYEKPTLLEKLRLCW